MFLGPHNKSIRRRDDMKIIKETHREKEVLIFEIYKFSCEV